MNDTINEQKMKLKHIDLLHVLKVLSKFMSSCDKIRIKNAIILVLIFSFILIKVYLKFAGDLSTQSSGLVCRDWRCNCHKLHWKA